MSAMRFISRLPRPSTRLFSTTQRTLVSFDNSPAPPRLPEEEQKIFEKLQQQSTGAFSTPMKEVDAHPRDAKLAEEVEKALTPQPGRTRPQVNQSPKAENVAAADTESEPKLDAKIQTKGKGEELHPNIRRGAQPEFQGDINPKTGETNGPKNEPLRWGGAADWSYNGRVTDF